MADSDVQRQVMVRLIDTLADHFAPRPDVYVTGDLLLYYEEGNPRASAAPDVMVVFGVPKQQRLVYKLWEEGQPPAFAMEITSASSRRDDQVRKPALYARLGIAEYFLFDPFQEYLRPPLQGYRLEAGTYRPLAADADGGLHSERLGIRFVVVDGDLRLQDGRTGAILLSPAERTAAAEAARDAAEAARDAAEARAAAQERELAALRAELERRRASE
jgi:Uma2 family endonuclease